MLVKAVKAIRAQFECRRHMKQIRRASAQFGRGLAGQLPRSFDHPFRCPPDFENPVAHILFEVDR